MTRSERPAGPRRAGTCGLEIVAAGGAGRELGPGGDAELAEDAGQVGGDRALGDEHAGGEDAILACGEGVRDRYQLRLASDRPVRAASRARG